MVVWTSRASKIFGASCPRVALSSASSAVLNRLNRPRTWLWSPVRSAMASMGPTLSNRAHRQPLGGQGRARWLRRNQFVASGFLVLDELVAAQLGEQVVALVRTGGDELVAGGEDQVRTGS